MTNRQMDTQTDRISYLRLNPFCGRGRVKRRKYLKKGSIFLRRRRKTEKNKEVIWRRKNMSWRRGKTE